VSDWEPLDALLRCPKTGGVLQRESNQLVCADEGANRQVYPLFDGIPWVLPNPSFALVDWQIKISTLYEHLGAEARALAAAASAETRSQTRARLDRLAFAKKAFGQQIAEITQPLLQSPPSAQLLQATLPDQAPRLQTVLSYEANIYRDWVWGQAENAHARDIMLKMAPNAPPEKLLMVGIGAGRLLYDIHNAITPKMSIGTDINPFLMLSAARLLRGQDIRLAEFPREPRDDESVVLDHLLKGVEKVPENVHLVFANVMNNAFEPEAFNWVVTPWVIDILTSELPETLRALNQYLPVGGYWLNFGSLVFHQRNPALCFTIEEVIDVAADYGFEIECHKSEVIPYLKSPHNVGYRMEQVWCWRAVKTKSIAPPQLTQNLPPWLLDFNQAVPAAPYLANLSRYNALSGEVLGWANGQLSLKKMASRLAKKHKVDKDEAKKTLIQLYRNAYEQSQTKRY